MLKIELPYILAVPFLGIQLQEMKPLPERSICTLIFIVALFKIAETCPLTDEWIKCSICIQNIIQSLKRKKNLLCAGKWMNLEGIMLGKISHVWAWVLSHVWLFVTPWTVAHQPSLSVKFSSQVYQSELSFPSPRGHPTPRNKPTSLASPVSAGRFFSSWTTRSQNKYCMIPLIWGV